MFSRLVDDRCYNFNVRFDDSTINTYNMFYSIVMYCLAEFSAMMNYLFIAMSVMHNILYIKLLLLF